MSVRTSLTTVRAPGARGTRLLRLAWTYVALIPVAFILAMLIGEGLIAAQGIELGEGQTAPLGAVLLAAVPAVLVAVAPAACAALLGFRAHRHGATAGTVPAWIGILVAAYLIAANLVPWIITAL